MMLRKIVKFDEEKCNGCGLCASACHEMAIRIIDGKAKLLRDDYCDGMGDCLPHCPMDAISFEMKDTLAYDELAVEENKKKQQNQNTCLKQWPCQIKLAPVKTPFYHHEVLLIAATCTAFSYKNFHEEFMKDKITLVGCPKLDEIDYSLKLGAILKNNQFTSIELVKMEVPCCNGLEAAIQKAIQKSGKELNLKVTTLFIDGKIL